MRTPAPAGAPGDDIAGAGGAIALDDRTGAPIGAPPLPATDLPLRYTLDQLKRQAAEGDPRASCRLAMELDHCNALHESARMLKAQASRRPIGSPDMTQERLREHIAFMGRWADNLDQSSWRCEGAPIASPQERMHHWRAAALGGHVPAMTHYAIGSGFRRIDTLQNLAALETYSREAETMARRAAAAGDPLALSALIHAYTPDPAQYAHNPAMKRLSEVRLAGGQYLRQAVKQDLVEALALTLLARQADAGNAGVAAQPEAEILAMRAEALDSVATPEQRRQALERMQQLRTGWTPIDPHESTLGPPLLPITAFFDEHDDRLEICETGRRPPVPRP